MSNMISFRPMTKDEYPAYLEYFVNDYACEIEANYGESLQDSLARAKQEISEMLPEGVNTHGQVLMCIIFQLDKAQSHVGYLWYKPDSTKRTAFIYDFHIFNSNRGWDLANNLYVLLTSICRTKVLKRSDCAWQVIMLVPDMFMKPAVSGLRVSI